MRSPEKIRRGESDGRAINERTRNPAQGVAIIADLRFVQTFAKQDYGEALPPTMHRPAPLLPLPAGDIHLWLCPHGDSGDPALDATYRALLTPQELQQKDRFHFPRDRHRYLLTRVLVRTILSRYAPIDPHDWRFANGPFGRPRIDVSPDIEEAHGLDFNLSHTAGLIVLAIARNIELGVDVENIRRPAVLEAVDHFFAPAEAKSLGALPAASQPHRFFELWTLKESYIKARGMGLQIPLDSFAFALDNAGDIGFSLADPHGNAAWHFQQLQPTPDHMVALCTSTDARIVCRETSPLQWERMVEVRTTHASRISPLSSIPPS
ncbi:4'-phosphopantetheinyl transferase [Variovorax boronicumulans]|uniref:4'-phosphopantetheinyl transferase family protein n=1 Tax=Variovorax boronicumulans TaxID=436515 RepID=UPI00278311A1|nr:4'-phosphopantetheinyl transferase superfamily protein [Variovorax boronicumulans]MDQ0073664.1 4'-phosphopantetheinyl transferase [Variovorax boronicumulans]